MQNNNLIFNEDAHTYTENGKVLISVTQLLKKQNIGANYDAVSEEVLKKASLRGTAIHFQVECILKNADYEEASEEAKQIANEIKKLDNYEIKSELRLASHNDFLPYAGTIDILAIEKSKKKQKEAILYDIKTSKTWTREQEIGARWQLSLYAYALREQNIKVGKYIILRFSNEEKRSLILTDINPINDEEIEELLTCESNGEIYQQSTSLPIHQLDDKAIALFRNLKEQEDKLKQLQNETKGIKEKIYEYMKENDIYKATSIDGTMEITRTRESVRNTIDAERLKTEQPIVYGEYSKKSTVKGSIRINFVENNSEDIIC